MSIICILLTIIRYFVQECGLMNRVKVLGSDIDLSNIKNLQKLNTTINKISMLHNSINSSVSHDFHHMRVGSRRNQNNNLKTILAGTIIRTK